MGILNATPDSFYDGGRYLAPEATLAHARQLLDEGADIIDLGVASSRPGAQMLTPEEEASRLVPLVRMLRHELPADAILSVDTCWSLPARQAVEAGADIINDISGGQLDAMMFPTVATLQVPYVLMHMRGTPATMQLPENTCYGDIVEDLTAYFDYKLDKLYQLGVRDVILDPGFGFAKTLQQNHELLRRLDELVAAFPDRPLLSALSNKSMITQVVGRQPEDSESGTTVFNTLSLLNGARLLRVHSPRAAKVAVNLLFN